MCRLFALGLVCAFWGGCTTTVNDTGAIEAELLASGGVTYQNKAYDSVDDFLKSLKSANVPAGRMIKYKSANPPSDTMKQKITSDTMKALYYATFISEKTAKATIVVNTSLYGSTQLVYKSQRYSVSRLNERLKREKFPAGATVIIHSTIMPTEEVQDNLTQALKSGGYKAEFRWKKRASR